MRILDFSNDKKGKITAFSAPIHGKDMFNVIYPHPRMRDCPGEKKFEYFFSAGRDERIKIVNMKNMEVVSSM